MFLGKQSALMHVDTIQWYSSVTQALCSDKEIYIMQEMIPILSLVIAILAVFFGPIISWKITERQISSSLAITNKQIVALPGIPAQGIARSGNRY